MMIDNKPEENNKDTPKALYVKPLIRQVKLVPGESVLGSCKLNDGVLAMCGTGEVCFGYTPFS